MILYQFDVQNVKTKVLIKRSNNQFFEKIKNRPKHQIYTLLTFDKLEMQLMNIETKKKLIFVEKISNANKADEICFKIRRRLKTSDSTSFENENLLNHKNCEIKNEFFFKEDRL